MASLRYDDEDVAGVQKRLGEHVEAIERLLAQIEYGVQFVQDGAWYGVGADAFLSEYFGDVVPHFQKVMGLLGGLQSELGQASGVMLDATQTVREDAANVVSTHSIF